MVLEELDLSNVCGLQQRLWKNAKLLRTVYLLIFTFPW